MNILYLEQLLVPVSTYRAFAMTSRCDVIAVARPFWFISCIACILVVETVLHCRAIIRFQSALCFIQCFICNATSDYAQKLPQEAKQRYLQKLQLIGGTDPFCISTKSHRESLNLPPFNSGDLVSYLVLQTSYLSAKQIVMLLAN